MANPAEIADRAMTLASSFLEEATQEIVAMSEGKMYVLFDAAQDVKSRASHRASEPAAEHLAFSLLSAAHAELRARRADLSKKESLE